MATARALIKLDGSTLEGGGQLLRNAVALSALTRTPVHIPNVRQGRDKPGLKAQHAAGLELVSRICNARTEGLQKGSGTVSFDPTLGYVRPGAYKADPGTAGSTALLLQVSLPCLLFPEPPSASLPVFEEADPVRQQEDEEIETPTLSTLTLRGGTNALHAPQADYVQLVLFPFLITHILPPSSNDEQQQLRLDMKARGFFPYGGGLLRVSVPAVRCGQTLRSVTLTERGQVVNVRGTVIVGGTIGKRIANEMREAALEALVSSPELTGSSSASSSTQVADIRIDIEANPKGRAGSTIILLASTSTGCVLSGSAIGSKSMLASRTGREAVSELTRNLSEGGCVDCWMQDQMIIFLALAKGRSTVRTGKVTLHTRTAIWVAERLTGAKFEVTENIDGTDQSSITCEGIGIEGRL